MAETKSPGDKLSVPTKTLTLKPRVETGTVRQSFSHGRSKQVVVEKRGKRRIGGDAPATETAHAPEVVAKAAPAKAPLARPATPPSPPRSNVVLRTLTEDERSARASALADAKQRDIEERRIAEEEARRRNSREGIEQAEREAAEARRKAEEERHRADEEAKRKAEAEAKKRFGEAEAKSAAAARAAPAARAPGVAADASDEDEGPRQIRRGPGGVARAVTPPKTTAKPAPQKQRGRLTLVTALNADDVRERSIASFRRRTQRLKGHASNEPKEKLVREVTIPEAITIQELANRMAERAVDVIRLLMKQGQMVKITDVIDADTAQLVAEEMGHTVKRVAASDVEEGLFDVVDDSTDTEPRSPVVTVMGHVDHGKTSLLDALRHANVAAGEAGGITQHIGAYQVDIGSGRPVTFIDTPGHAAFTAMRARGASVTDIVVLVVAADDGVMPQTVEAISHAKAAGVPMIVAINKVDKADANPDRVKQELLSHDVVLEDFGGDVLSVPVSATQKINLDRLIETLQLQAELLDLRANPNREAHGTIVEARLDRGRGVVATVLVQRGTLKVGDIVVAGSHWGRARALLNDRSELVTEAGPAMPVEILGLDGVPEPGDALVTVDSERQAREITEYRQRKRQQTQVGANGKAPTTLEEMFNQLRSGAVGELPVVLKSDVHGSLEAITAGLEKMSTEEVKVRILFGGVGAITESDVTLASASNAAILGFNVRANAQAREMAKRDGVEIRYYSIIYEILDEVRGLLSGMLKPESRESILGHAEIRQVFDVSKVGKIAGCRVVDGLIRRTARARLLRDNVVIYDGQLGSLRRFKDDVREVRDGFECGMSIENYNDIREGDVIEAYEVEEVARTL